VENNNYVIQKIDVNNEEYIGDIKPQKNFGDYVFCVKNISTNKWEDDSFKKIPVKKLFRKPTIYEIYFISPKVIELQSYVKPEFKDLDYKKGIDMISIPYEATFKINVPMPSIKHNLVEAFNYNDVTIEDVKKSIKKELDVIVKVVISQRLSKVGSIEINQQLLEIEKNIKNEAFNNDFFKQKGIDILSIKTYPKVSDEFHETRKRTTIDVAIKKNIDEGENT
jgi:membrane protease subunit (stomatin/prohibitin family)